MSDFMMDDDEEYEEFEYSGEIGSEPDVDLENQYYNSKALKEHEPLKALESFQKVIDLEDSNKGDWGFKALKQMIKLNFRLKNYDEMLRCYKQLLTYLKSAVTRNYSEKSINSILDHISSSDNMEMLEEFYETTLEALKLMRNDRLWFKTNCKLGKLYYDQQEYAKVARICRQLRDSCLTEEGEDDVNKGTQLMEVYALEIQMYSAQKNNKALKRVYEQSLHVKSAIPHPLIMGIIRECGGKMHLRENLFDEAHTDFFEAFKNYDESGSPRRITCLKYLVLANLLMKSDINPFDSQEAKAYKNDPEIIAMTDLIAAYQEHDIEKFENILRKPQNCLMNDDFIREHVEILLRNVRTEILRKILAPFVSVKIENIASRLNTTYTEVVALLKKSILDKELVGLIDEPKKIFYTENYLLQNSAESSQLDLLKSIKQLASVCETKCY